MTYDASALQVLPGLMAVRMRPALYVGPLDDPTILNRLIQEALCSAIDEAVSGCCTQIHVSVSPDGSVTIRDNGRGLSMTPDAYGRVVAETSFSELWACRRSKENARLERDCCQMGLAVVNALSEWLRVRNFREGVCWVQQYRSGEPLAPFRQESRTAETGLELSFRPDPSIFGALHFDAESLARWVSDLGAGFGPPEITSGGNSAPTVLRFEALVCTP